MSALETAIDRVCDVLVSSGFTHDAQQMRYLFTKASGGGASAQDALTEIHGRASIKDLGDLNVAGISDQQWLELLSTVRSLSAV